MAVDPQRRKAVTEVVKQHPGMSLIAISPAIVVFGVLWVVLNFWSALIIAVVVGGAGYLALTRAR